MTFPPWARINIKRAILEVVRAHNISPQQMYPFHSGRAESTLNNKLRRLRVSLPGMGSKSSLLAADYVYVEYLLGFGVGGSRSSSADSIWTLPIVLRVFLDRSSRKGFIMSVRFCWRDWIKIIYGRSVTYISTGIWILTLKFYFPCAKMTLSSKPLECLLEKCMKDFIQYFFL